MLLIVTNFYKTFNKNRSTQFLTGFLFVKEQAYIVTIGGRIGQSRLCMILLQKAHIGEVHVSVRNEEILKEYKEANIQLL